MNTGILFLDILIVIILSVIGTTTIVEGILVLIHNRKTIFVPLGIIKLIMSFYIEKEKLQLRIDRISNYHNNLRRWALYNIFGGSIIIIMVILLIIDMC